MWTQGFGGRRGWDKWREYHGNIYTTICKRDSQWQFAIHLRELKLVLCDILNGWDRVGSGREVQAVGDIGIPMAIHFDVWQKPKQYCNAINLQLQINKC